MWLPTPVRDLSKRVGLFTWCTINVCAIILLPVETDNVSFAHPYCVWNHYNVVRTKKLFDILNLIILLKK